ncbi:MAG: homocysteine S-methyltransferase family protein, partial [Bacteroidota bacterium]|nr:homocysteine S-methyltransferase family protein [Bacteroidota bacterium]
MIDEGIFTRRILILDGAMGTMIQRYASGGDIKTDGNNDRLNLTCREIIASIHREYADAGADILETNTFGANRISQLEYGCPELAASMSREGARIAREVADEAARSSGRRVLVAGSMGPTGKSLTLGQDPDRPDARTLSFDDFVQAYAEQAEALASGGVDLLLLETCFDALNTKAAIYAIQEATKDIPLIISVSVSDRSGRTLTGQTLEAFYTSVRHAPLLAFGVNCSLGARDLAPLVREIARFSEFPVLCYPNAGLPNEMGQYDETPERMAGDMRALARPADFAEGIVNLVGGCCGTTADHIRALAT